MLPSLMQYTFDSSALRIILDEEGDHWFVLRDVLEALGSSTRPAEAKASVINGLGDGVVNDYPIPDALGRLQATTVIAESAVTFLVARSNTETGRRLNRFIHIEVLPQIRRTGRYAPRADHGTTTLSRIREAFEVGLQLATLCGFTGNQQLFSADHCARAYAGASALELLGVNALLADPRGRTYTPTQLGQMLDPPVSAQVLNKRLEAHGLQTCDMTRCWTPTSQAEGLYEWLDTQKHHRNGTPVKQLKWFPGVLEHLGFATDLAQRDAEPQAANGLRSWLN